ncbi:MAG: hypothetical protein PHN80_13490 [Hespellia sp.]|nr:hypothetical protein [Hespellia sp.]
MKRRVIVSITIVTLLCSIVLYIIFQRKNTFIEGVIITKNEQFFTLETDIQEKINCYWPEKYDNSVISIGDRIRVYYSGEILETSPARLKNVKEIKK